MERREFLGALASAAVAARWRSGAPALRFTAVGQSLILRDLASQQVPGLAAVKAKLSGADIVFSNFEAAVGQPLSPPGPSDPLPSAVIADARVLDSLRDLSMNLLSLSNNHADDAGAAGFRATIDAARNRGFVVAGTGETLAEAAAPGYLALPGASVALVAMASSAIDATGIATETRPGVNHLAVRGLVPDASDAQRILNAIRTAAARSPFVVVYQHDHYWAPDWQDTPEWKKAWCRACIDAGATVFVSHGVPLLHGIEIYKRRPIFYGLGNFIFHLSIETGGRVPPMYAVTPVWQSVIARCEFGDGEILSLEVDPITLQSGAGVGEGSYRQHGNPQLADGTEALEILERLQLLSRKVGTEIAITGTTGRVKL
jgi:poly-gamma-glutamate capsule biosynthesis protein CapA/YwtB (metallophosphatase superfamily)